MQGIGRARVIDGQVKTGNGEHNSGQASGAQDTLKSEEPVD